MRTVEKKWLGFYRCWEFSTLEEFKRAAEEGKLGRSFHPLFGDYKIQGSIKEMESEENEFYPSSSGYEASAYLPNPPTVTKNFITLEDEAAEVEISYEDVRKLEVLGIGLEDRIEAEGSTPVGNKPYDVEEIRKI